MMLNLVKIIKIILLMIQNQILNDVRQQGSLMKNISEIVQKID